MNRPGSGRVRLLAAPLALFAAGCVAPAPLPPRAAPPSNVLLVTLDTLRADHVGAWGNRSAETPALDRLAREGIRFDQAISAVPLTLPSHATILSGRLPPQHGLHDNGAGSFPADRPTLATAFAAGGYRTAAFVGSFVLDHRFGLARGFDVYDDEIERDPSTPGALEAERPGRVVVDRALAWLAKPSDRPFFAWVHLYDAHAPYTPPEPFASRHAGSPYDGEIAEVDAEVARLLEWLDREGLADRTIVAIAGDHGEGLGDHGELTHGLLLYEPTLRVPMLLRAPGLLPAGRVVETPVGLVDLAPTLAALAGQLLGASGPGAGRDLSEPLRKGVDPPAADVYSESEYPAVFGWSPLAALRRRNLKFIAAPEGELYDLARDPGEATNLLPSGASRDDLAAKIAAFRTGAVEGTPVPDDAEGRAKLASLGYIGRRGGETPATGKTPGAARNPREMVGAFRAFEEAHWALLGGRTDEALARLVPIVEADPGNAVFVDALAQGWRKKGEYDRAIDGFRRVLELAPDDPDARYNLAATLQEAGRGAEAFDAIREAIRLDDRRPESFNVLGIAYFEQGKVAEALEQFDRAARLDPQDARAENNRGNALRELGRLDEAMAAYRRAAELAPRYADPWNGLGAARVRAGRPKEALADFDRALELDPASHEARLNRGIALEMLGDRAGALAAYRAFLEKTEGDAGFERQREVARQLAARLEASGRP